MSHRGTKPKWLYESLPYLYLGLGLATMLGLRHWFGIAAGVVLMAAGALVITQRFRHRRRRHVRVGNHDYELPLDDERPGRMRLVWRKEFECGHPVIDAQHRGLIELANALLGAIVGGQSKLDVELMLDDLIADFGYHFRDEEAILDRMRHPVAERHKELHRQLLVRAKALSQRFQRGELSAEALFGFISEEIINQHILNQDRRFFASDEAR